MTINLLQAVKNNSSDVEISSMVKKRVDKDLFTSVYVRTIEDCSFGTVSCKARQIVLYPNISVVEKVVSVMKGWFGFGKNSKPKVVSDGTAVAHYLGGDDECKEAAIKEIKTAYDQKQRIILSVSTDGENLDCQFAPDNILRNNGSCIIS